MQKFINIFFRGTFLLASIFMAQNAFAVFSYPNCTDIKETDFQPIMLFTNATSPTVEEPLKMGFDRDDMGNVDVYFVQRFGFIQKYDAKKKTVIKLIDLAPFHNVSDGLLGIAMDPQFKTNHWIYVFNTDVKDWRIVRYTVTGETINPTSELVILKIPSARGTIHTGGAMQFDVDGNLWITVGENGYAWPSANTNDLRGKILRIKPKTIPEGTVLTNSGSGITYDIPAGNLFPVGTLKTKPEIYVMGVRNAYTLTLDPVRHAMTWGDVGPDMGGLTEEHDFTSVPGNFGYPYFAGANIKISLAGGGNNSGTVDKPINTMVGDTALKELPPAIPALDPYNRAIAMTGPVYYYDANLVSKVKWPPHFNGVWFVTDFGGGYFDAVTLDAKGETIVKREKILPKTHLNRPLDFQVGPDGAFYVVIYAGSRSTTPETGIMRIDYIGDCHPAGSTSITPLSQQNHRLKIHGQQLQIFAEGEYTVLIHNLQGQKMAKYQNAGNKQYDLSHIGKTGIYTITVNTLKGVLKEKIFLP